MANQEKSPLWDFKCCGTDFGPIMELVFTELYKVAAKAETVDFYFFTDGGATYPHSNMQTVKSKISGLGQHAWIKPGTQPSEGKSKFTCYLMCE